MSVPIAKIDLGNLTYFIPGGYNAASFSAELGLWELPRAQSFKGLWRWWLRALLSGALWEGGKLDEAKVREVSEKLLGSTKQASKLILRVVAKGSANPIRPESIRDWKNKEDSLKIKPSDLFPNFPQTPLIPPIPPRLSLLLRARETDEHILAEKISCYPPEALKIIIEILRRPFTNISSEECRVALSSLLLSLIFGGIGGITRRGFGRLFINSIDLPEDLQDYKQNVEKIGEAEDPNVIHNLLNKLIHDSLEDARGLLGIGSAMPSEKVPDFPVLSIPDDPSPDIKPPYDIKPFNLSVFKFSVLQITSNEEKAFQLLGFRDHETMKLLTTIGYSTTKLFWKLSEEKKFYVRGLHYNTWIMGLPRGQEFERGRRKLKTGYSVDDKDRRVSTIVIAPIKRLGGNSWIIALYGFLSRDWFDTLYHYGVTPPPKPKVERYNVRKNIIIPSQSVAKAFVQAWNILKRMYGVV